MTEKIFKMIKDNEVKFVDFRFTDPRGKWQHTAQTVESVDEDLLTKGIMFDGSSISGWKRINESDMIPTPDDGTTILDPFMDDPTLIERCDIVEPSTMQCCDRDPRSIATKSGDLSGLNGRG